MIKRCFDITAATLGLVILSPLFALIAILEKVSSPGHVFYRGSRVGCNGKPFLLYKFRSMVAHADRIGPGITPAHDSRITPLGHFLRKYKLDELPQLINVVKGDMSIVGPRPEDPRYVALYTEEQREILKVRPGITSPASIKYREEALILTGEEWEEAYIKTIMPAKLAIDLEYFRHHNFWRDLTLILKTLWEILSRKPANDSS